MTRKDLSQVYYLTKELKMWEEKLEQLRQKSMVGTKKITGMPFANTNEIHDINFEHISEIMELQAELDSFRIKIASKIMEIEKYIVTLDDSLLRQIIEYRCCQLKTWKEVSALIGYGTTEESVKKYFNRKFPEETSCPKCPEEK